MALQSMQGRAQHAASGGNLDTVPSRPEDEGRTSRVALSAAASQADAAACALVDLQVLQWLVHVLVPRTPTGFARLTSTCAQVKQAQFSERAQSLENTIASLRCTETELSAQLQEISLLLLLSQHAPGRSIAARESSVSPAHAYLIALVPLPCACSQEHDARCPGSTTREYVASTAFCGGCVHTHHTSFCLHRMCVLLFACWACYRRRQFMHVRLNTRAYAHAGCCQWCTPTAGARLGTAAESPAE